MVYNKQKEPVGYIRLLVKSNETEIVIVIGDRNNWGKRLGSSTIRESLKIAFFELRSLKVTANIHKDNKRSIRAFSNAGFTLECETPGIKRFVMTMEEYLKFLRQKHRASDEIYITELDLLRLRKLLKDEIRHEAKTDKAIQDLDREINKAKIVKISQVPQDVITMNSKAILRINGNLAEVSLVYPHEADESKKKLSVLSPVGTAILGYSQGKSIRWETPSGVMEIQIEKILYQPEAVGDYHL